MADGHSRLAGKMLPTLLALLCVGAIGSGINLARSVDALHEKVDAWHAKVEQNQQANLRRDRAQDNRLDRHDQRILYLERQDDGGGPYGLDHPATTDAR